MKKVFLISSFSLLVFLNINSLAKAEMVYYVDEQGKTHYVNTETAKIPEKYLPQIKDQMQQISKDRLDMEAAEEAKRQESLRNPAPIPASTPSNNSTTSQASSDKLAQVFVSMNCPACDQWVAILVQNKIPFARYDVDYHPYGQEVRAKIQAEVPFTMIGQEVILGQDIDKVMSLIGKSPTANGTTDSERVEP